MGLQQKIIKGEFLRNTVTLVTGTAIAQFIGIILYPVLSRLFTASEFGLLSTISQISAIIMVLASGKYESSILIAGTKMEAANIIGMTLLRSSIILLILYAAIQPFGKALSVVLHEPALNKWLFVCPISAFVIIIYNCFNEWCVRNKYYTVLSWNKIINTLAHTLSKAILGFFKVVGGGLVIGDLIGRTISAGSCVYKALNNDKNIFLNINKRRFSSLSKKYIDFPKYNMPDQLLSSVGEALPIFLLGAFFNNTEVGYYSMTLAVLSVPVSIISAAVRDVFRQRANEDYLNFGNCSGIFKKLLLILSVFSFVFSLSVFFILPKLFAFFLGRSWMIAGEYSQILLFMIAFSFIANSLSGVLIVVNKLKVSLYWQFYYVGITLLSILVGAILFKSVKATLFCFAIGRSSAYILYILLSYKYSKGQRNTVVNL